MRVWEGRVQSDCLVVHLENFQEHVIINRSIRRSCYRFINWSETLVGFCITNSRERELGGVGGVIFVI